MYEQNEILEILRDWGTETEEDDITKWSVVCFGSYIVFNFIILLKESGDGYSLVGLYCLWTVLDFVQIPKNKKNKQIFSTTLYIYVWILLCSNIIF